MARIILEGLTGSGKSQTLRALSQHAQFSKERVFEEDKTFGEVMAEMQEPDIPSYHHLRRLDLYVDIDERLSRLGCLTILLHIPADELERRSLDRIDRAETAWLADMIAHFGSRAAAVEALVQSTQRRAEAARKSKLPLYEIDTRTRAWENYADEIVKVWSDA